MVPAELAGLEAEIGKVADELTGVVEDLREIARGIHPAILSEGGLGRPCGRWPAGPRSRSSSTFAALGRLPEPVEVAAYYVVSEALTNATRHARASVMQRRRLRSETAACTCRSATTARAAPIRPAARA